MKLCISRRPFGSLLHIILRFLRANILIRYLIVNAYYFKFFSRCLWLFFFPVDILDFHLLTSGILFHQVVRNIRIFSAFTYHSPRSCSLCIYEAIIFSGLGAMILMADLKNVYKTKVVPHTMPHPQKERHIQTKRITTRFLTFFNYCVLI